MSGVTEQAVVRKTITVRTSVEHAFSVFTEGYDSWWPRSHHIGKSPMKEGIIEPRVGGRCYTKQVDGTESDWGQILEWEPPHRFVLAWQITHEWGYEPDAATQAAQARDLRLLYGKHSGLASVQLQPIGTVSQGKGALVEGTVGPVQKQLPPGKKNGAPRDAADRVIAALTRVPRQT